MNSYDNIVNYLNNICSYSYSLGKYINYDLVFSFCILQIKHGLLSCEYVDDTIASSVCSDVNIYGLYPNGNILNNSYFFNRTSDGFDNVVKILRFLSLDSSFKFPNISDLIIKRIVQDRQIVEVDSEYDIVSENSIDRYSVDKLIAYLIENNVMLSCDFYNKFISSLKYRTYYEEANSLEKHLIKKKIINR